MKLEFEAESFRELRAMVIEAALDLSRFASPPQPPPPEDLLAKKRIEKKPAGGER